jgi:glutamate/tyrosine decarboxylase-like PLP-dependent enzyme
MVELSLLRDADRRGQAFTASVRNRRVFPDNESLKKLEVFSEPFPETGLACPATLELLDSVGSPATVVSNGPNYFGFVIGASLPSAAAAERLMLAWDQCAFSNDTSPVAATLEKVAAGWVLDALDLPRDSAVGFGTSATACSIGCLTAGRRSLLANLGWDFDRNGLFGAPEIKVIVPDLVHITVKKALRLLGFGTDRLMVAPTDAWGRVDPDRLPPMDEATILCLQAGEVNTGEFDPFEALVPRAKAAGAWVHVDGAFGLWARASIQTASLTDGIELADSWTVDGHKWLNTPYDGAMAICRDAEALAQAMNSDAVYATAARYAQKNLTLEFSRRARGIPIWAALRTLGRDGLAELVERHVRQASRLAEGLRDAGFDIANRVVLNQVLVRGGDDRETIAITEAVQSSGQAWFGPTVWRGKRAFRLSVSSWRTQDSDIDALIGLLVRSRAQVIPSADWGKAP